MRSLLDSGASPEYRVPGSPSLGTRLRRQPLAARLRLGLELVARASAALPQSPAAARALASSALATALPTAEEERRPAARPLLLIAADLAATAYCVEAEAWLHEGRASRAAAPAALARLLALHGSGDPLVFGALEAMLGLQAWLLGEFGKSLRHLERAIGHFVESGEARHEAEVWGRTAVVLEQAGLVPEAEVALARVRQLEARGIASLSGDLPPDGPGFHTQHPTSTKPFSEHRT